jgi:hypothetical protein
MAISVTHYYHANWRNESRAVMHVKHYTARDLWDSGTAAHTGQAQKKRKGVPRENI